MKAVRNEYAEIGVENYYIKHAIDYFNPHEQTIHHLLNVAEQRNYIGHKVLDLCCGSGEVTNALEKYNHQIIAVDPYTFQAYYKKTGRQALELSFKDIVQGKLNDCFDTIICSFALHLCEPSLFYNLLWQLSNLSSALIVISPNKKPDCDSIANWLLVDEIIHERVRMKTYFKTYH
jgi:SAM-dependent methyltransferase